MLTQNQIAAFGTQGYLTVPGVIPDTLLAALRQEYAALLDRLYEGWVATGRIATPAEGLTFWDKLRLSYAAGCDWFQPMDISLPGDEITEDTPFHFGPAVFDLVTHPALLDIVESLIGPEITLNPIQHVRIKPPAVELSATDVRAHVAGTDWHQDRAVAHEEADGTRMITCWIAVTDATVENGCLQVAPVQERSMLPHCPKKQTAIADGYVDEAAAIPLPVPAGGLVLLDPMVPHASLPNRSTGFRWSFDLRYNVTGQHTGRAHFPSFVVRSTARPDSVLTNWQDWKAGWVAARSRLATAPHIPIHRWSSDAPFCA